MFRNLNSNVGSGKGKHTEYARMTSFFRKLDNELEKEKLTEKKKFVRIEKDTDVTI